MREIKFKGKPEFLWAKTRRGKLDYFGDLGVAEYKIKKAKDGETFLVRLYVEGDNYDLKISKYGSTPS